jgi:hypothetical protein
VKHRPAVRKSWATAKFVSPGMAAANAKLRRCLDSLFEIPEEPPQPAN